MDRPKINYIMVETKNGKSYRIYKDIESGIKEIIDEFLFVYRFDIEDIEKITIKLQTKN